MKTLQNNFTTPEQSKRLLELGVPADSADCYLTRFGMDEDWEIKVLNNVKYSELAISNQDYCKPCWSVGRLIKILKICITDKNELREIFDELEMCIDEIAVLIQTFKEFSDVIDFSKLEE